MSLSIRSGGAFRIFFWHRKGICPIFCFKLLEYLHLIGTYSLCGSQFISSKIIALPHLLLDRALNIAECELRGAPARPIERVAQKL